MRNLFLKAVTAAASFAAVGIMIVSLGTSPALARGGGGHGRGGGMASPGGSAFHTGGGFHPNGGHHGHSHLFGSYNACANPNFQPVNPTYPPNYSCL